MVASVSGSRQRPDGTAQFRIDYPERARNKVSKARRAPFRCVSAARNCLSSTPTARSGSAAALRSRRLEESPDTLSDSLDGFEGVGQDGAGSGLFADGEEDLIEDVDFTVQRFRRRRLFRYRRAQ